MATLSFHRDNSAWHETRMFTRHDAIRGKPDALCSQSESVAARDVAAKGWVVSGVSRRAVLTAGLGAIGLGTIALVAPSTIALAETSLDDANGASGLPVRSHFVSSVGKPFTATNAAGTFTLTLKEIHDLTPSTVADDENRFNLIFVSRDLGFTDGIVTLRRRGVPTSTLFISSIGQVTTTQSLQALVNRQA
jgi:hypothetical protein